MRLINVATLDLEEFVGEVGHGIPLYAILSHTWEAEEASLMEYVAQTCRHKKGYQKIKDFCRLVESEGFRYAWVDTCCIDKTSSAELSEAINSMFQWYRDAAICYAYLADVDSAEDPTSQGSSFASSRWFTRGWTLQELLAPTEVVFLASDWAEIGTKKSLRATVSTITRINEEGLEGRWARYSVAQKMSWAAGRCATRPEDEAYCLMGLFDVNMPLLYGEGRKAFFRLQQEILKLSEDQSIFAWSYPEKYHSRTELSGLLAASPEQFRDASQIEVSRHDEVYENPFEVVNRLVRIRLRLLDNIKAMKLRKLTSDPCLWAIAQVHQLGQPEEDKQSIFSTSSTPRIHIDEVEEDGMDDQAQNPLGVPLIMIEDEDRDTEKSFEEPDNDLQPADSHENLEISTNGKENESTDTIEYWVWYIYEPVTVAPLKCHIGGNPLGIFLSRGSIEHAGLKVLSRLHNPSLVAMNTVRPSSFTSLKTTYASTGASKTTARRFGDAWGLDCFSWPEIRISGVLSAGYIFLKDCGLDWFVDQSDGTLRQARRFQSEADMVECTPLIVFYHDSGNDAGHPTFFMTISKYSKLGGVCSIYVGLARAGAAALLMLDYKLFSADLAHERRVEVPLGNGKGVVIKLREGPTITFISLSIADTSRHWKSRQVKELDPSGKIGWLNSRLFPVLRVLQKTTH